MAAPIRQSLQSLLNGVTQQPQAMRPSSQASTQDNLLSSLSYGLRKRPPTTHVALLDYNPSGYDTAFIHSVNRDEYDRYDVIVVNGDLKVFDKLTGAAQTVLFTDGKGYLSGSAGFRAATVGDYTFLVNKGVTVKRGTTTSPTPVYEALLFVRQADFSTPYSVTLNGTTVTVTTVDMVNASSRAAISTTNIAADLMTALQTNENIAGQFSVLQYGSTIYLTRFDGADFTMTTTDGLADKGLKAVKGQVQTFEDLPARAKHGMIVKVAGDLEQPADDYWVSYDDEGQPQQQGVWRECAAPNTLVDLDATTMPWALVRRGAIKGGLKAHAEPPQPFVSDGVSVTYEQGFTADNNGNTLDPNSDVSLTDHGQTVYTPGISNPTGGNRLISAALDIDTSTLIPGEQARVDMLMNSGSGYAIIASQSYDAGQRTASTISTTKPLPNGSTIAVTTSYSGGRTPPVPNRTFWINVRGLQNNNGSSLTHSTLQSRKVAFNPVQVYPSTTQVSVGVDGTYFSYTCSGDTTGTTMATALVALINADSRYHADSTSAGVFVVKRTADSTAPLVVCTVSLTPATTLTDPTQNFITNEHVGRILKNVTDGSSATITGNSAISIITTGLLGGSTNKFNVGDVCEIDGTGVYYVFRPVEWDAKGVGSGDPDEYPSFIDTTIAEVFFFQDRLGFTADENVVMSQTGNLFNFFRQTATNVLADDLIDVQSTFADVARFDHAIVWNADLYLFSGTGHQFLLSGDPLTPSSVRIDHVSSYPMSGVVRPHVLGSSIFWCHDKSANVQVFEYLQDRFGRKHCVEQTKGLPTYIPAHAAMMTGDAALEFLAVLSGGNQGSLYVYQYHLDQVYFDQKQQASWSEWTFPGASIIGIDMMNGVLSLVVVRSDGVYLETIDVGRVPDSTADYRDRQGSGSPVAFTTRYGLSQIFLRTKDDAAITSGRTQLRYLDIGYTDTTGFTVNVTAAGRPMKTYTFASATPVAGSFRVPVLCDSRNVTLEIVDTSAGCCAFTNIEWEGTYTNRDKLS